MHRPASCDARQQTWEVTSASLSAPFLWFRVDVRVGQPHESAIFTLWDRECCALIKETIDELKQKMIDEDGVFDARDILEQLDRVLGKKLAFRFKVVPGNTRHSVSQLSDDDEFIKFVISKLPTLQHQQCLSAITESDPTLLGSITPPKHILPLSNSQVDEIPFEDLSSIQLSSTTLGKKHIKIE
ncbi:hypothetical protein JHK82_052724 [Glycine max]|nr:hypothetical protein JHK86_052572 [Glycine max]KAG5085327.1 hypothetical protein JHK82_052724 [Glycine max]